MKAISTLAKCMGWMPNKAQCDTCLRLPLKPKDEDAKEFIDPPHWSPCTAYKARG